MKRLYRDRNEVVIEDAERVRPERVAIGKKTTIAIAGPCRLTFEPEGRMVDTQIQTTANVRVIEEV